MCNLLLWVVHKEQRSRVISRSSMPPVFAWREKAWLSHPLPMFHSETRVYSWKAYPSICLLCLSDGTWGIIDLPLSETSRVYFLGIRTFWNVWERHWVKTVTFSHFWFSDLSWQAFLLWCHCVTSIAQHLHVQLAGFIGKLASRQVVVSIQVLLLA